MNYLEKSKEYVNQTIAYRRYFHQHPEICLDCQETMNFIEKELISFGYKPERCGSGLICTCGKKGKTILLRADVDALPMKEESGLEFCSQNDYAHTCGHDFHGAMLLMAARLLKENEENLDGTVKFMFQAGEEVFKGAKDMLDHGVLENTRPDVCLAYHVSSGDMPVGLYMYNDSSTMMNSSDNFTIEVKGKGCHGAYPESGIDPIHIACHIVLALEGLIARETKSVQSNVLTIGKIQAGDAGNIIPESCFLYGTLRCDDKNQRDFILKRMKEIIEGVATTFRGQASLTLTSQTPPLICDSKSVQEFVGFMNELDIPNQTGINGIHAGASDDLAYILSEIPGAYMYISAGFADGRINYAQHHPKVVFNEEVCQYGPAYYAHCATRWLQEHR
ncbi:MAG: M20 family metallopeptidase [Floccifex sp.]